MALQVDRERYTHVPGMLAQAGEGADMDAALDDAVEVAHDEVGHSGVVPSVADVDPSSVEPKDGPALPLEVVVSQAVREVAADEVAPGTLRAARVATPASWKRRKVTLRIDDPDVEIGKSGTVAVLTAELEGYLREKLVEAGEDLDGTLVELVEVRNLRGRWKPEVTTRKGKRAPKYVAVVRETGEVVGEGRTAGEARRAAVAVARAGAVGDLEQYTLDIEQRIRLEEGPVIEVKRARIAQRGSLRITLATEKDPAKTKTAGWLFYGQAGSAQESHEGDETV